MLDELEKIELVGGPLCGAIIDISADKSNEIFWQEYKNGKAFYKKNNTNNKAYFIEWKPKE